MNNITNNEKMPAFNQALREAAYRHLIECGLPDSLIDGVDCSSFEAMEESLARIKECFFASVRRHIEETYGVKEGNPEILLNRMKYEEKEYWQMFREMNFTTEQNKHIANLCDIIRNVTQLGSDTKSGQELKRLYKKGKLLEKVIESGIDVGIEAGVQAGIDQNLKDKFNDYTELQSDINIESEREAFICGFRTAYHLLEECRA